MIHLCVTVGEAVEATDAPWMFIKPCRQTQSMYRTGKILELHRFHSEKAWSFLLLLLLLIFREWLQLPSAAGKLVNKEPRNERVIFDFPPVYNPEK